MIIEKTVTFKEPAQKIWDKITGDMQAVIYCMPGVQSVEALGDNKYRVDMEQKVGFIPIKFKLELKVINLSPPAHLETTADGTAHGGLGKAFQKQSLDLVPVSESITRLVYKGDLTVSGRIGTFGQRVLGSKTESVAVEFLKNFVAKSGLTVET